MKKMDFTRGLFLIFSLILVGAAFILPEGNITNGIVGAIVIITLVVIDVKAPSIVKLSEENVKVKVFRSVNRFSMGIIFIVLLLNLTPEMEKVFKEASEGYLGVIALAVFIMIFGNIAPNIPWNRYIGFRLPWTIRDEDAWKIAHRVLGYSAFPIGILMILLALIIEPKTVAVSGMFVWMIIPGIISYKAYRNKFKNA